MPIPENLNLNHHIVMDSVESSNIEAIGYSPEHQILRVNFKNGSKYWYCDVPQIVYNEMKIAPSIGAHLASKIKKQYECFRFDVPEPELKAKIVENTICKSENNC